MPNEEIQTQKDKYCMSSPIHGWWNSYIQRSREWRNDGDQGRRWGGGGTKRWWSKGTTLQLGKMSCKDLLHSMVSTATILFAYAKFSKRGRSYIVVLPHIHTYTSNENTNKGGGRKFWNVTDISTVLMVVTVLWVSTVLMVVTVLWVYTYPQTHQVAYIKHV